jgi:hypothetical protein
MWGFLFLSDARRHPVQFPARAFDPALCLFLLPAIHLRQGFGEPPAGAMQNGNCHLQFALQATAAGLVAGGCRCVFQNSSGSARIRSRTTREPSRQAA